jgi:uncharacterized membrane protein
MTRPRFFDLLAFIICIIPFATWFIIKDSLPEKLPIHWNAKGKLTRGPAMNSFHFFYSR